MRERWLQTLWGRQNWNGWPLRTCQGQSIQVLDPGRWNNDQGPDFLFAQIFIDQVLWVGSVEIHIQSGDWFRHQHAIDPRYQPVILHVVWMQAPLHPQIPTLELSRYLTIPALKQTLSLLGEIDQLACYRVMRPPPTTLWNEWRNYLLRLRFERKAISLKSLTPISFRNRLARQMGAWINRDVFENIDASISESLVDSNKYDLNKLTALYLGQAGLLTGTMTDQAMQVFQQIYFGFQRTYALNPPYQQLLWMRVRPAANPLVRLRQLAVLIHLGWHHRDQWGDRSPNEIRQLLAGITWQTDHHDGAERVFSDQLIQTLLINIWSYTCCSDEVLLAKELDLFGFEDNRFTRLYSKMELNQVTAADSQAMLELNRRFCIQGRCKECALGGFWSQDQAPQSI